MGSQYTHERYVEDYTCQAVLSVIVCLNISATKILIGKNCTIEPFLRFTKMHNIIQIQKFLNAKTCRGRRFFNDLINNCPGKYENLKPQKSLSTFLLYCFLFRSTSQILSSEAAVLRFCKISWKIPAVNFCFSCRAQTSLSELCSMLSLEF